MRQSHILTVLMNGVSKSWWLHVSGIDILCFGAILFNNDDEDYDDDN